MIKTIGKEKKRNEIQVPGAMRRRVPSLPFHQPIFGAFPLSNKKLSRE